MLVDTVDPSDRVETLDTIVGFRAQRGEPVDEPMAELEQLVGDATDIFLISSLLDARAYVAFAEGRLAEAHDAWRRWADMMAVPAILTWAIRAATWNRDLDAVQEDFAALEASGHHGPVAEADRRTIRAAIAAMDGRTDEARGLYREALRAWRDLGQPYREALTAIDMATLIDPTDPEVRAAAAPAREILVRLGAAPLIARLDAAIAAPSVGTGLRTHEGVRDAPVTTA